MKKMICALLALVLVLSLAACTPYPVDDTTNTDTPTGTTANPEAELIEITAVDLYAAYDANEVAADLKYKDKTLKITGTVKDIGKDILDRIYITLETDELLRTVCCYISKSSTEAVAQLKEGDTVTLVGKCKGMNIINVDVENCEVQ